MSQQLQNMPECCTQDPIQKLNSILGTSIKQLHYIAIHPTEMPTLTQDFCSSWNTFTAHVSLIWEFSSDETCNPCSGCHDDSSTINMSIASIIIIMKMLQFQRKMQKQYQIANFQHTVHMILCLQVVCSIASYPV